MLTHTADCPPSPQRVRAEGSHSCCTWDIFNVIHHVPVQLKHLRAIASHLYHWQHKSRNILQYATHTHLLSPDVDKYFCIRSSNLVRYSCPPVVMRPSISMPRQVPQMGKKSPAWFASIAIEKNA